MCVLHAVLSHLKDYHPEVRRRRPYLLKAYSPVNRTGSPQGCPQVQISHKLNTIQNMHILIIYKRKTYTHNPKVSPFGIALVKNGK